MNLPLFDVVNIRAMVKNKDYGGITVIVIAFLFLINRKIVWGLAFGGIAVLWRVLFLNKLDRRIDETYTKLSELIKELQGRTNTRREIRFEDLEAWLPNSKKEILEICWKKLQENKVVQEDANRWFILNK